MRGRDKLLEYVAVRPLLRHLAQQALLTGWDVVIPLPTGPLGAKRQAVLTDLKVSTLIVVDADEGMAAGLRAVASRTKGPLMIVPADMPDLTSHDLQIMIAAHRSAPDRIIRATSGTGQPGHPVVLPAGMVPLLLTLRGDQGARDLLRRQDLELIALDGQRAVTDLDTPEDWARWRALSENTAPDVSRVEPQEDGKQR
ncbi:nucleotidyltransferase family protein [Palleronia caenipelagi]|uniref:Nucleotidyltransferase family protein n=2 Tax=Palleronia caenipelagi TaxID=2489174 RepID=A0A547Q5Y9_9RHOB|nr:nucleotidyltransferase family protein [Palleronia caenipelagi]